MRLVCVLHDPGMAALICRARPGTPVATYGGTSEAQLLRSAGAGEVVVVPPEGDLTTLRLLEDARVAELLQATPSRILCFKPSTRLERLAAAVGADVALAPAGLARRLENKLLLPELASDAGVRIPRQQRVDVRPDTAWDALVDAAGPDLVVQSPRGFSGKRTFRLRDEAAWTSLRPSLAGRPAKVAEFVDGRPGTLHAVVDAEGHVVVSAPIIQVTGVPLLTPYPLGSCGNDFTWRPRPIPSSSAPALGERVGAVLAERGYRGAFGLDFVVPMDGSCVLIEINPRLTASFALYASREPSLLENHLDAVGGGSLAPRRLPPLPGGQLIVHTIGEADEAPKFPPAPLRAPSHPSPPHSPRLPPTPFLSPTPFFCSLLG